MKSVQIPSVKLGIDVVSPEGEIPEGAVRTADNVLLTDGGAWQRGYGSVLTGALTEPHSLWRSTSGLVLCASGLSLYTVSLGPTTTFTEVYYGLPLGEPVSYTEAGSEIYFCTPGVLGKITADLKLRIPGIVNLLGSSPTLVATNGGLLPGTYGVAYSLTNDLGEESGLSSIAWLELVSGGGITVSGFVYTVNVSYINLYITAANGQELYLNETIVPASSFSITDQRLEQQAVKYGKEPMPGGQIVRYRNGRLYVASGKFIYISDPFDLGLYDVKSGWLTTSKRITMLQPVRDGIFVGDSSRVMFYRGSPEDFSMGKVYDHAAIPGTGATIPADFFAPEMVPDQSTPVAVWLADCGMTIGLADGSVVPAQVNRITLSGSGNGHSVFHGAKGISQGIFVVDDMVVGVGGPNDTL